jgi:hypothetical protein
MHKSLCYTHFRLVDLNTGVTSLLAGNGDTEWKDNVGVGAEATFSFPTGITTDPTGNMIYITDTYHNRIRAISRSQNLVTTIAGPGVEGSEPGTDGIGTTATFSQPSSLGYLQTDVGGWLAIADTVSHLIRLLPLAPGAFYERGRGFSVCLICPAGKFTASIGLESCEACPAGKYAPAQSQSCTACPEGSTTGTTAGTKASDCVCDSTLYPITDPQDPTKLSCTKCPVGARCPDGTCALNEGNQSGCTQGSIFGTWVRQPSDNTYILSSCPAGYQKGTDSCTKCAACSDGGWCTRAEYIVNTSDVNVKCQTCPEGAECNGSGLRAKDQKPGAVWTLRGQRYYLIACPVGHRFDFVFVCVSVLIV